MTVETFLQNTKRTRIIDLEGKFVPIDMSADNRELDTLETSADFEAYIRKFLDGNRAIAAFGGYLERRNLYRRSDLFEADAAPRDIHLGVDIWAPAGTAVLAPLDGTIHSFDYNAGLGNYGPTIILHHKIDGLSFYTLYGHLDAESLEDLELGDIVKAGQTLAFLGEPFENGDYAPHLHFQVILDMEGASGDYPGVCAEADLTHYRANCPDPNLLLKLNEPL